MVRHVLALGALLATALFATGTQVTQAQVAADFLRMETAQSPEAVRAYWTPARLAGARPRTPRFAPAEAPSEPRRSGAVRWSNGRPPEAGHEPNMRNFLYRPSLTADASPRDEATPDDVGTEGAHFTSSRVIPYGAVGVYPFSAAGKLFFSDQAGNDFLCSASVIDLRIVVTAGHCVHEGSGGAAGAFVNFLFVPGYIFGVAPFGEWTAAEVLVTNTWATGGGTVPNAADYAMMEMNDQSSMRIGSVTGMLGWQTGSLNPNHVTMLGYPASFDFGELMHRVDAESFRNTPPNTVEYGSDMSGGSSGGPWVQNFGEPSFGQSGGVNAGLNRVVGITSYGFTSPAPKTQGSSVPDSRWEGLFDAICANRSGNCNQ